MGSVIFIVVMAVAFLILSVFLFRGKGAMLIAGFNTLSPEEREKYDRKKLCRSAGAVCLVVSLLLFGMAYFGYRIETGAMPEKGILPFTVAFIVIIAVTIGISIWYDNVKCKK